MCPTHHVGHPHHRFLIPGRDFRQAWFMNSFTLLIRRFVNCEHETVRIQHTFMFPASSSETLKFTECHSLLFYLFQNLCMSLRMLLSLCLQGRYDACWIYDLNYTSDRVGDVAERGGTVACQNWEYSREVFKETIVTEVSILLKSISQQLKAAQCINCQSS